MDRNQLAKHCYDAYCDAARQRNFLGNPMPSWMELPTEQKISWAAAADRVKWLTEETHRVEESMGTLQHEMNVLSSQVPR